jgi:exocyst complex component 2
MRPAVDYQRAILNHYNIATPYPTEWPADKDDSDGSDDEHPAPASLTKANLNRKFSRMPKSRYSVLDRNIDRRPSAARGSLGSQIETVVQKDESDPLGTSDSVISVLRKRGLPVDDDITLRNRFLLSSTTFSPGLFLAQVHGNANSRDLSSGLAVVTKSIDQKSASLKVLVESNFERFVRAKATIDTVYNEMRNQGPEQARPLSGVSHSRNVSRGSVSHNNGGQLRSSMNGPLSPPLGMNKGFPIAKKKTGLTKENEFGVGGIRLPLAEAGVRAQEVWGPILGGRDREVVLKTLLRTVERHSSILELSSNIAECIKRKDHDGLIEEYNKARRHLNSVRRAARAAAEGGRLLTDEQSRETFVTARMWVDVDAQVEKYKKELWKRLVAAPNESSANKGNNEGNAQKEEYMDLIGILLELGVDDNPIWVWLLSRYDYLKNKITATTERARVEIEILRRRLANKGKPSKQMIAVYLRGPGQQPSEKPDSLDSYEVIELWEHIQACLGTLLSPEGGILGELIEFWNVAQNFIDGKTQGVLPAGADGESRKHHRLSSDGVKDLQNGAIELVNLIRDSTFAIFVEAPPEDISLLVSPSTPMTPRETISLRDPRFLLDPSMPPPSSPKPGESWERYAFWPPYSNSISGAHYLAKFLVLVGNASSEMALLRPVGRGSNTTERLKSFVAGTRERCVQILCDAWSKDAEYCKYMEDWRRSPKRPDETHMPSGFLAYETTILSGLQKVLYISEAKTKSGAEDVVSAPPTKLLQLVRSQFVGSLYKALSGMVENAETSLKKEEAVFTQSLGTVSSASHFEADNMSVQTIDASNRNVRRLLTLSNLQTLRSETVPQLLIHFENAFSVKLTDESKTVKDVLSQIDARLFQSFTSPYVKVLAHLISSGISSPDWSPGDEQPRDVRPYIYDCLLSLVLVHAEVSTTAGSLTPQILAYLLEQACVQLLEAFKKRKSYSLNELMQATLDVEFLSMTMPVYVTDKASEYQSQIYLELDKATDNDARRKLQVQLSGMREVLKELRDNTKAEL